MQLQFFKWPPEADIKSQSIFTGAIIQNVQLYSKNKHGYSLVQRTLVSVYIASFTIYDNHMNSYIINSFNYIRPYVMHNYRHVCFKDHKPSNTALVLFL